MPTTCLLVDDSRDFLVSGAQLLESQGITIVGTAAAGDEALEIAHKLAPDVALVDIELGEENGIEVAAALMATASSTTIIFISTHDRDDLQELIAGAGAAGFIPKHAISAAAIAALLS
jgi:two-component system nitrate/nitrite response regulator NarL